MKFSEREGFTRAREEIQLNDMDSALRNRIWNALDLFYWSIGEKLDKTLYFPQMGHIYSLFIKLYHHHFKIPVDTLPQEWTDAIKTLRDFYFKAKWYEVYDFIEFVANEYNDREVSQNFKKACNTILESEMSAYRFVGNEIAKITSGTEIETIEEALQSPFSNVNKHLENALKLMANRKTPDYRNSIKESISAIEALCRLIIGEESATLGKALDIIERKGILDLSPALKQAFDRLYGYTCSEDGIRHAFSDKKIKADFEEAKFMLVSCSAFVNYLKIKISKAGLKIK